MRCWTARSRVIVAAVGLALCFVIIARLSGVRVRLSEPSQSQWKAVPEELRQSLHERFSVTISDSAINVFFYRREGGQDNYYCMRFDLPQGDVGDALNAMGLAHHTEADLGDMSLSVIYHPPVAPGVKLEWWEPCALREPKAAVASGLTVVLGREGEKLRAYMFWTVH